MSNNPSLCGREYPSSYPPPDEAFMSNPCFSQNLETESGHPFTYADAGDPDGAVILYCLPSFAYRWLTTIYHRKAIELKIRILAIDRPGNGGTLKCPLEKRIDVYLGA